MQVIEFNPKKYSLAEIDYLAACFQKGQVLAYPTDTIYGLGALANRQTAIKKISKIKGRAEGKSFLFLVSSLTMMAKYGQLSRRQKQWIKEQKKPTTVILAGQGNLLREITAADGSVALRLISEPFLAKLISRLGVPLISSSVNLSGERPLIKSDEIIDFFLGQSPKLRPDLIIAAPAVGKKPSRLVDLRDVDNIKILRK